MSDTFVGRAVELARIGSLISAPGPTSRLALVVGEPGIGKSRLLAELGAARRADGHTVVRGGADELDSTPFGLWRGPVRQLGVPRLGTDPTVPAAEQRWEALDLLAQSLSGAGPVLVLLDDLHWADDDSLWVLDRLAADLADDDVFFLASSRPEPEVDSGLASDRARWHAVYRQAEVVALIGLDPSAVGALVRSLGAADLDAATLHTRTGGNPFLVREIVTAGAGPLPTLTTDLVARAIDRTGDEAAATLALLAVAGPDAPLPVVATARDVELSTVEEHLEVARSTDVVRTDSRGRFWFRHALLADAAGGRLDPAAKRAAHLALARAWETLDPEPSAQVTIARHLLLAVPLVAAADAAAAALVAGNTLATGPGASEAERLFSLAASVTDEHAPDELRLRARLHLAAGKTRWVIDDADSAIAACERAVELATPTDDVELTADAEVAAIRHHNPFVPDPVRLARLTDLDRRLAAAPPAAGGAPTDGAASLAALRIELLGRRAVLAASLPERLAEAATSPMRR